MVSAHQLTDIEIVGNICGVTDSGQTLFLSRLSIACVTRETVVRIVLNK